MDHRTEAETSLEMQTAQSEDCQSKTSQSRADELEERLIDFSVRIIKLSSRLPRSPAGKHIAGQILRSGTSPAPNYGEARGAESANDFIHKLGVVLKELNETFIWLQVIERSEFLSREPKEMRYFYFLLPAVRVIAHSASRINWYPKIANIKYQISNNKQLFLIRA